jgi:hypothetical protein
MKNFIALVLIAITSIMPCSFASEAYVDFSEISFAESASKKIKELKEAINATKGQVRAIDLSQDRIDSKTFDKITDKLDIVNSNYKYLMVVNLEDNHIDENAANSLAIWLKLKSRPFINISNNPISLKNVYRIFDAFQIEFTLEETRDFMRQIIFMSKEYVNKAKRNVQVYKSFERKGIIPYDWDAIHHKFYNLQDYKDLLATREENKRQEVICKMKKIASDSPRKSIKLVEDKGEDEEDSLPDSILIQNLANLSINTSKSQ